MYLPVQANNWFTVFNFLYFYHISTILNLWGKLTYKNKTMLLRLSGYIRWYCVVQNPGTFFWTVQHPEISFFITSLVFSIYNWYLWWAQQMVLHYFKLHLTLQQMSGSKNSYFFEFWQFKCKVRNIMYMFSITWPCIWFSITKSIKSNISDVCWRWRKLDL